MSHTMYGNTTLNGINIDDMVDDNRDIVYTISNKFFARLVCARENIEDDAKPAIAVFTNEDIFYALFAKVLPGSFEMYHDGWDTTDLFDTEFEQFVEDYYTKKDTKTFQFSYENEEAENGVGNITYKVKGDEITLTIAEWLWRITLSLSNAEFRDGKVEDLLEKEGYDTYEIERMLKTYPEGLSEDPLTAYDQCISKFKEMGLEVTEIDNCNNPDVWTSHGVY